MWQRIDLPGFKRRAGSIHRWLQLTGGLLCIAAALLQATPAPAGEIQDLEAIRVAVESFVAVQTPEGRGKRAIEVTNVDSRLRLTPCEEGLRTFFAPGSRTGSRRTVGVSCNAPKPWTIYVAVRIVYYGEVLVAARSLARGAILQEADLTLEERNLETGPSGYLTDPYQAIGMRTTRPLRLGMPISRAVLEEMQVVERGQRVWLVAESRRLRVRMAGTALEQGAPGDRIRVRNSESERIIQGIVDADGVVRVAL